MSQQVGRQDDQTLAERYRQPSRASRRAGVAVVAVLVAALGAWAIWAAVGQSRGAVGGIVESYRVTSEHQLSVTVQISRQSSDPVRCTVSAIASDHSTVGETVVKVPRGDSGTTTVTASVKTERRAVSADIAGCR